MVNSSSASIASMMSQLPETDRAYGPWPIVFKVTTFGQPKHEAFCSPKPTRQPHTLPHQDAPTSEPAMRILCDSNANRVLTSYTHLGVDAEGFIVASQLTESGVDDASVGVAMIERIEAAIDRFTADGAYETRAVYEALISDVFAPTIVVAPRKTASVPVAA